LEHGLVKGPKPMSELTLVNLYVESTRIMNPQGCDYLSKDHSINHRGLEESPRTGTSIQRV
jgi:hypothetical protein